MLCVTMTTHLGDWPQLFTQGCAHWDTDIHKTHIDVDSVLHKQVTASW